MSVAGRLAWPALLVFGLVLAARGWAAWIDPLVDFGRELYVPWQLSEGQVLYRDLAYLDGPFSPYLNALWFTLFPVSLRTLEVANLGVLAATALLLFGLLRRLGGEWAGFAAVAVFLSIFAFNLIGIGGNMNWVAPYSHGVTHGIALGLASLWLLSRYEEHGSEPALLGSGFALGLAALTKPEVFAATALAFAIGIAATCAGQPGRRPSAKALGRLAAAIVIPFSIAGCLLGLAMPAGAALRGALGGWPHLLGSDVGSLHFYRWLMGIDEPARNLAAMARYAGLWILPLAPAFVLARRAARPGRKQTGLALGVAAATGVLALASTVRLDWGEAFRPLPALVAIFVAFAAADWWRGRRAGGDHRVALDLALASFGLALLLKIALQPVLWGYGFALAVPAMSIVVLVLVDRIPAAIEHRGGHAWTFRATAMVLLAVACLGCLRMSGQTLARKDLRFASGSDAFRTGRLGNAAAMVGPLLDAVEAHVPSDATLLVLPEGVMINYLSRRRNPTPHVNFVPPEIAIFGEAQILADLRAAAPDYVVLVHRDTREYGLPLFGTDYAESLLRWAREEHALVVRAGATPLAPERLTDGRTGFEIRERR